MKFPVVLHQPDTIEPSERIYYRVARNGIYQVRTTSFYRAVTRANPPIPGLLPAEEKLEIWFPRLPATLLEEVASFFIEVFRIHGGEAIVILFFDPASERFEAGVPQQSVPGYRTAEGRWRAYYQLQYRSVERPSGFLRFGTIHSHGNLPAFSSLVDQEDESHEDGLHVVLGDLDLATPSRSAAFGANGVRFRLDPDQVLEPFSLIEGRARPEWMACVTREEWARPICTDPEESAPFRPEQRGDELRSERGEEEQDARTEQTTR